MFGSEAHVSKQVFQFSYRSVNTFSLQTEQNNAGSCQIYQNLWNKPRPQTIAQKFYLKYMTEKKAKETQTEISTEIYPIWSLSFLFFPYQTHWANWLHTQGHYPLNVTSITASHHCLWREECTHHVSVKRQHLFLVNLNNQNISRAWFGLIL